VRVLGESVRWLDTQVQPALVRLLQRRTALGEYLSGIESGRLPAPDRGVLRRLRAAHVRQSTAVDSCLRQAANTAATLVALLQEDNEAEQVLGVRRWAGDLLRLHNLLVEEQPGDDVESNRSGSPSGATPLALALLRERYVAGTIDLAQYEQQVAEYLRPNVMSDERAQP
jgi:hypothetical protein